MQLGLEEAFDRENTRFEGKGVPANPNHIPRGVVALHPTFYSPKVRLWRSHEPLDCLLTKPLPIKAVPGIADLFKGSGQMQQTRAILLQAQSDPKTSVTRGTADTPPATGHVGVVKSKHNDSNKVKHLCRS
jgi:hypothetical protein